MHNMVQYDNYRTKNKARVGSLGNAKHRHMAVASLGALWLAAMAPSQSAQAAGPLPVTLGSATRATILSESGITDVPASTIIGNVGTSPITGAADLLTCAEVSGYVLSVDAAGPAPCSMIQPARLTSAINDMIAGYLDAASRTPDVVGLGGGNIGGYVLPPGVYQWSTGLLIPTSVTLQGTSKDVWIFQVAQDVDISANMSVIMAGGARPGNVYWQVGGQATIEPGAHFEGTILSKTLIAMQTGATICGRLLAQTAVTLQQNYVMIAY